MSSPAAVQEREHSGKPLGRRGIEIPGFRLEDRRNDDGGNPRILTSSLPCPQGKGKHEDRGRRLHMEPCRNNDEWTPSPSSPKKLTADAIRGIEISLDLPDRLRKDYRMDGGKPRGLSDETAREIRRRLLGSLEPFRNRAGRTRKLRAENGKKGTPKPGNNWKNG